MYNQTNVFKGGYGDTAEGGSDSYIDLSNYLTAAKADPVYINETGDTMRGILDMGGYKITNLALPTTSNDAVTKSYCDSIATQVSDSDYVAKLEIPANASGGNMATAYDITLPSTVPSGITNARIYLSAMVCTFAYTAEVFAVTIKNDVGEGTAPLFFSKKFASLPSWKIEFFLSKSHANTVFITNCDKNILL